MNNIIYNKKAKFNYEFIETITSGMVLYGWEVKSLRIGNCNLRSAWIKIHNSEAWIMNFSITPWRFSQEEQDKNRDKKLLLHKKEIIRLDTKMQEKRYSLIPIKIFIEKGKFKCELALAKGRKKYEKKQVLKERSIAKETKNSLKKFNS